MWFAGAIRISAERITTGCAGARDWAGDQRPSKLVRACQIGSPRGLGRSVLRGFARRGGAGPGGGRLRDGTSIAQDEAGGSGRPKAAGK
jgi:hypothetical protein